VFNSSDILQLCAIMCKPRLNCIGFYNLLSNQTAFKFVLFLIPVYLCETGLSIFNIKLLLTYLLYGNCTFADLINDLPSVMCKHLYDNCFCLTSLLSRHSKNEHILYDNIQFLMHRLVVHKVLNRVDS